MKLSLAAFLIAVFALTTAQRPGLRVIRDVKYLAGANYPDDRDTLDLYLPEGKTAAPVIVSFHGGALTAGAKRNQAFIGERFAAAGIATVIPNYRLSPGVSHPAHVQDAAASVAWVKRHIKEYGGDPNQLFLIGHSAGAYLAALLATDGRYLKAEQLSLHDIRGVVPVSAFYWVERPGVAPERPKEIWGTDEKTWIDASPAHHLHPGVPPMLVIYADGDAAWRRQQNEEIAQALVKMGASNVQIAKIADRNHSTIWSSVANAGDDVAERIIAFVRQPGADSVMTATPRAETQGINLRSLLWVPDSRSLMFIPATAEVWMLEGLSHGASGGVKRRLP